MRVQEFERIDRACKKLGLTTADEAVLLQLTPAMVARYRSGKCKKLGLRDVNMYPRAVAAIKEIMSWHKPAEIKELKPKERLQLVSAALRETAEDEDLNLPY